MKTTIKTLLTAAIFSFATHSVFAQVTIPGKVFVAEVTGSVTLIIGGKVVQPQKGQALTADGAHIETAPGASLVLVYSNGTSIYIDQNTIIDIRRFVQQPFASGVDTTVLEPSVSDTLGKITQGRVVITTNELATGTSMVYQTPESQVRIRGKDVVIEVQNQTTNIVTLTGSVTVTPNNAAPTDIGQSLSSGQMAVVTTTSASTTAAPTVQVAPITQSVADSVAPQLASTERAQSTVVFESVSPAAGANGTAAAAPVIQVQAVVPATMPVQLTVSPSTLRSGT